MFDIKFTSKTFKENGEILILGAITLGEITEGFSASLSFWSKDDYEKQWLEAAKRLVEPDSHSAFITCMYNPDIANFINWWPVWRTDSLIVFQEQLLFISSADEDENYVRAASQFSVNDPYAAVSDWDSTHCDECQRTGICRRPRLGKHLPDDAIDLCPSEWCTQLDDVQEFINRRMAKNLIGS